MSSAKYDNTSAAQTYHSLTKSLGGKSFQRMPVVVQPGDHYSQLCAYVIFGDIVTHEHTVALDYYHPENSQRQDVYRQYSKNNPQGRILSQTDEQEARIIHDYKTLMECCEYSERERSLKEKVKQNIIFENKETLGSMDQVMATGLVERLSLHKIVSGELIGLRLLKPLSPHFEQKMIQGYKTARPELLVA